MVDHEEHPSERELEELRDLMEFVGEDEARVEQVLRVAAVDRGFYSDPNGDIVGQATEYLDVISGEAVTGANVVSDIAAGIRDVVGGRSGSYEKKIEQGRREAINDPQADAQDLDADAVAGAAFDYEEMRKGCSGSTFLVLQ